MSCNPPRDNWVKQISMKQLEETPYQQELKGWTTVRNKEEFYGYTSDS
jgi:hypothetical protein